MDKLQTLCQSIGIDITPTQNDLANTASANIEMLEETRRQVQIKIDCADEAIISYIKFNRASIASLVELRDHIDAQIKSLQAIPTVPIKAGKSA